MMRYSLFSIMALNFICLPLAQATLQFSETNYRVNEIDGPLTVTVKRIGDTDGKTRANFFTKSASAKAGSDFKVAKGSLTWAIGEADDKTFDVAIIDDFIVENNETFIMILLNKRGTLDSAKITIVDNDVLASVSPLSGPFSAPACYTKLSIKNVCRVHRRTLPCDVTIEENASISQAIFECDAENKGLLSNSTIKAGATVKGGILTGYIINEGLIANFDFRGASIIGGTLSGMITNNSKIGGWFQDVHLAPNTHINGGTLKGEITGDLDAPALLENLEIKAGVKLSGVIIGENVQVAEEVEFGEGVEIE